MAKKRKQYPPKAVVMKKQTGWAFVGKDGVVHDTDGKTSLDSLISMGEALRELNPATDIGIVKVEITTTIKLLSPIRKR